MEPESDGVSRRIVLRNCAALAGLFGLAGCNAPLAGGPGDGSETTTAGTTSGTTTTPPTATETTRATTTDDTTTQTTQTTTQNTTTQTTQTTTQNTTTQGELKPGRAPWHVTQGDRCLPVFPIEGDQPVEQFYDYRNPYNTPQSGFSYSTRGPVVQYEFRDASILMLYRGPNGLSLVVVHGEYLENDEAHPGGAAVSMEFDGLPMSGNWVVRDDRYDQPSNVDRWETRARSATVDWTWGHGRTDGGVYRGLNQLNTPNLTITPQFNEQAALYGQEYSDALNDWLLVTGETGNPRRFSLDMSEPVTLSPGPC